MRLKNILIVVKDIEHSKQFYHDLFGLNTILDNDGNVILTEGLVLQDEKIWKEVLNKDIIPENHASELYFEEPDIEAFARKLEKNLYNINTFDQPSVEQTRNYTYGLMGRIGYEESAKALHDKLEYV